MAETTEFDVDGLMGLTSREAAVLEGLGRLCEGLAALDPTVGAVVSRYAGADVRIRYQPPLSAQDARVRDVDAFEGVVARLVAGEPSVAVRLLLPGTLCDVLACEVLGCGRSEVGVLDGALSEAVVLHLLADVLRALPDELPVVRLESLTTVGPQGPPALSDAEVVWHVRLRVRDHRDLVSVTMPAAAVAELGRARWLMRLVESRANAEGLRFFVSLVVGVTTLPLAQIGRLEPTDVVIVDVCAPDLEPELDADPLGCDMVIGSGGRDVFIAPAGISERSLVVGRGESVVWEDAMLEEDEGTIVDDRRGPRAEDEEDATRTVRELPVRVVVEVARTSLSVARLLSLAPGTVLPLERPASAEVTLRAQGRDIAHGVLVRIEDELGVEILKVER